MGKLIKATVLSALLLAIALYIVITTFAPGDTAEEKGKNAQKILKKEVIRAKGVAEGLVAPAPAGQGTGLAEVMKGNPEPMKPAPTSMEVTVGKEESKPPTKEEITEGPKPEATAQAPPPQAPPVEPVEPKKPEETIHQVEEGDTLSQISLKYYGTSKKWPLIARVNPRIDPDCLRVGQKLKIPSPDMGTDAQRVPHKAPVRPEEDGDLAPGPVFEKHKIEEGETLCAIAEKYLGDRNRFMEIAKANPGLDPDDIRAGQVIRIPVAVEER